MFIVLGFLVLLATVLFIGYVLTASSKVSKEQRLKEASIKQLRNDFASASALFASVKRPSDAAVTSFLDLTGALDSLSTDTPKSVIALLEEDVTRLKTELAE